MFLGCFARREKGPLVSRGKDCNRMAPETNSERKIPYVVQ